MIALFYAVALISSPVAALLAYCALGELNKWHRNWLLITALAAMWAFWQGLALWAAFGVGFLS